MSRNRTQTDYIIVTDSSSHKRQDIGLKTINKEHVNAGIYSDRGLTGFHYIIRRSGKIELGRDLKAIGQGCLGRNDDSVFICLVGGWEMDGHPDNNFTVIQFKRLRILCMYLRYVYPDIMLAPISAFGQTQQPAFPVWEWQQETFSETDEFRVVAQRAKDQA